MGNYLWAIGPFKHQQRSAENDVVEPTHVLVHTWEIFYMVCSPKSVADTTRVATCQVSSMVCICSISYGRNVMCHHPMSVNNTTFLLLNHRGSRYGAHLPKTYWAESEINRQVGHKNIFEARVDETSTFLPPPDRHHGVEQDDDGTGRYTGLRPLRRSTSSPASSNKPRPRPQSQLQSESRTQSPLWYSSLCLHRQVALVPA